MAIQLKRRDFVEQTKQHIELILSQMLPGQSLRCKLALLEQNIKQKEQIIDAIRQSNTDKKPLQRAHASIIERLNESILVSNVRLDQTQRATDIVRRGTEAVMQAVSKGRAGSKSGRQR